MDFFAKLPETTVEQFAMGGGMQLRQIEDEKDLHENVDRINDLIKWFTRLNIGLFTRDVLNSISLNMSASRLNLSKLITEPIQEMADDLQKSDTKFQKLLNADTQTRKNEHCKLLRDFEAHLEVVAAMNECAAECTSKSILPILSEKRDRDSCENLRKKVEAYSKAEHFSVVCDDDDDDDEDKDDNGKDLPAEYLLRERFEEHQMRVIKENSYLKGQNSILTQQLEVSQRQLAPTSQHAPTCQHAPTLHQEVEEQKTTTTTVRTAVVGSVPGLSVTPPQPDRPRISKEGSWRKGLGAGLPELAEDSPDRGISHSHVATMAQRIANAASPQHSPKQGHRRQSRQLDLPGF